MRRVINRFAAIALLSCLGSAAGYAKDSGVLYGVKAANGQLIGRTLDLSSGDPVQERGKLGLPADERLDALFQDRDRSIGVVRTTTKAQSNRRALVRKIGIPERLVDASAADIAGLPKSQSISSLLIPHAGAAIALIAHYTDTLPFWLASVDLSSGQVTRIDLPLDSKTRYSHLTQCHDSSIYAVSIAPQWNIRLVRLNLAAREVEQFPALNLTGTPLRAQVFDLACGPGGQLYVLSQASRTGDRSVFRVDLETGAMTFVAAFDVDRMVFVR
jgi:hypothetical protein